MKVVLDTNILVSGAFWTGDSFKILKEIDLKHIETVLSKELIEEYLDVINRDDLIERITNKNLIINSVVQRIIEDSAIIEPGIKFDIIKDDPDDNKILECAFEGKVDYIITQDNHLLKLKEFEGIKIITPEEFLRILKFTEGQE